MPNKERSTEIHLNMKKVLAIIAIFVVAAGYAHASSTTVTLFGTSSFTPTFSSFTTSDQTANWYQVVGNDFGSAFYGDLPSPVNITGDTFQLSLTATYVGTAASNFQIDLFDGNGNDRLYQGNFSSFTQNVSSTVLLSFVSQTGSFDATDVTSLGFLTDGTGSSVNITATQVAALSAIPEPSTFALLGFGIPLLFRRIRRRILPL